MLLCGMNKNIRSLDFTEFNPSIEDYNSSLFILNMIYYFLMGYRKRNWWIRLYTYKSFKFNF
jgi:hypothetical protein